MRDIKHSLFMRPSWFSYRDAVDPKIDVVVSSFGGAMTTTLLQWLRNYKNVNSHGNTDNLKHTLYPPVSTNPNLRLVYIFDDPILSILSLFRRQLSQKKSTSLPAKMIQLAMIQLARIRKSEYPPFVIEHYLYLSRKCCRFFLQGGELRRA